MQICSLCFRKRDEINHYIDFDAVSQNNSVTTFYCCGEVPRKMSSKRGKETCKLLGDGKSFEWAVEAFEDGVGVTKIVNPTMPYNKPFPEPLCPGRAIEVQGKLENNAKRFSINLATGRENHSDLALHFNPRIDRHIVIRNHRIGGKWGLEEVACLREFPFTRGRNFSVLIFVADEQFLVAINKIHYCAFAFRIPLNKIKSIIILGDISLHLVEYSYRHLYPPLIFKKTPFIIIPHAVKTVYGKCKLRRRKLKEITVGSKVEIFGRLKLLPKGFYVNLQNGLSMWPHPIIPFHMSFRMYLPGTRTSEAEVIFNSWLDGYWGKEEILRSSPFLPGMEFHLKIVSKSNSYCIYADDKFLYEYQKRSNVNVDAVVIHGDVIIFKVVLH